MKKLPIKKKQLAKKKLPLKRKSAALREALPKRKAPPRKKYATTNQPPPVSDQEIRLCMAGKWLEAAKAHHERTGVMYRRSLVAVSSVYRKKLQAVLVAIKKEISKGR